jgi:polyisoprenyl-teichoic acid--peptidoglycan teichoic acid transferase
MRPKFRRAYQSRIKFVIPIILLVGCVILLVKLLNIYNSFSNATGLNLTTGIKLILGGGATLKQVDGRTNILVLGIGGLTHDGPDLTDTILVVSLNLINKSMTFISIPRDVWSDSLQDKINSAYHYGEAKNKGDGLTMAKVTTEEVLGIPINYSLLIDFSSFTKIIDLVDGIDVNVAVAFTDDEYPITGKENDLCNGDLTYACRYESIHFDKGIQHMDGTIALKYVRSRHSQSTEGSDFARNRRQQEVIIALKQKMTSLSQLVQLKRDLEIFKAMDAASDMDLSIGELLTVGKITAGIKNNQIHKVTIEDLFIQPSESEYGGRFVLIPQTDWDIVHAAVKTRIGNN